MNIRRLSDESFEILIRVENKDLGDGNYSRTRQGQVRLIFVLLQDERLAIEHALREQRSEWPCFLAVEG